MPVVSHEVYPLFIEPYFRASIAGSISPAQIEFIKNLKMVNNPENMISENLYIFEEPELKSIKEAVQEVLDIYARDVLCIPQKICSAQSWSLICMPGAGVPGHSHSSSNCFRAPLYYCDLPDPPGSMVFTRHVTYQQIELPPDTDKRNIYNSPINRVTPRPDDACCSRRTSPIWSSRIRRDSPAIPSPSTALSKDSWAITGR